MKSKPIILLTGTIVPNVIDGNFLSVDERRNDYLKAIKYYCQYGKVVFIENSEYDFASDYAFSNIKNLSIIQFPKSEYCEKGKGYQEFEMIDNYIKKYGDNIESVIKITGRYIISEFESIYEDAKNADVPLIMDTSYKDEHALTYMFYTTVDFYRKNLLGLHKKCDDNKHKGSVEDVMYAFLHSSDEIPYRFFLHAYNIIGRSGSTGTKLINRKRWKLLRRTYISRKFRYYALKRKELRGV